MKTKKPNLYSKCYFFIASVVKYKKCSLFPSNIAFASLIMNFSIKPLSGVKMNKFTDFYENVLNKTTYVYKLVGWFGFMTYQPL